MRLLLIFLFSSISSCLLAQTKEIAFKSHSGNMKNFKIALENELFNTDEANFGLPPEKKTYRLDSVIYISDTVAVLVTRTYSRLMFNPPADSVRLVKAGRDTVYNDPLFTRKHSLDSIKNVLKANKKYINPLNKTVFIGFDNKKSKVPAAINDKQQPKENTIISIVTNDNNNGGSPFDSQLVLMLGTILMLSAAGGWLSWKFYQPRLQKA